MFESDYIFYPLRASAILTNAAVVSETIGENSVLNTNSTGPKYGPIQLKNQFILYADFTLGSLTNVILKVEFSNDNTNWYQETLDVPDTATGIITEKLITRILTASGNYRIAIKINDKYMRVTATGTGTLTNSLLALGVIIGNN